MRGAGVVALLAALATQLPSAAAAHTCYVSQEPVPGPYPGADGRYRWVLHAAGDGTTAPVDPCDCTAFRLGGVDTAPSGRGGAARPFNVTHLGQTPPEIHRALGCPADTAGADSAIITEDGEGILFPLAAFTTSTVDITFEVEMPGWEGAAHVYLADHNQPTEATQPPYKIELTADSMAIYVWDEAVSTYSRRAMAGASGSDAAVRRFRVLAQLGSTVGGYVEVLSLVAPSTPGQWMTTPVTVHQGKPTPYVGISSTAFTRWTFLES